MMTQTHGLIAATLLASRHRPVRHNAAILLGSFVPDVAVFGLFIWSKMAGIPERQVWREIYFIEPMLTFTAIANSLPLYCLILVSAIYFLQRKHNTYSLHGDAMSYRTLAVSSALGLFALAAITHLFGDFPVHASDAHPHFWPFTNWRFHSSVSYWDHRHFGNIFSILEGMLGIVLSIILFRRFKARWVRALTVLAICAYVAVPVYFKLALGT